MIENQYISGKVCLERMKGRWLVSQGNTQRTKHGSREKFIKGRGFYGFGGAYVPSNAMCSPDIPGIMGFTCNFGKALLRFPLLGTYNNVAGGTCVRHTGEEDPGKKVRARFFVRRQLSKLLAARPPPVPLVVTVVTHLRFHRLHPLAAFSHSPPSLPRARLSPLNVRQVIYTRGFTARKILRKAVTRDRNATLLRASSFPSENEKSFFYEATSVERISSYWGTIPTLRESKRMRLERREFAKIARR